MKNPFYGIPMGIAGGIIASLIVLASQDYMQTSKGGIWSVVLLSILGLFIVVIMIFLAGKFIEKMKKRKISKKIILKRYDERTWNLKISLLCSVFGGLVASIFIAMILGHSPLKIYQKIGAALIFWGIFLIAVAFILFIIFWFFLIKWPRDRASH